MPECNFRKCCHIRGKSGSGWLSCLLESQCVQGWRSFEMFPSHLCLTLRRLEWLIVICCESALLPRGQASSLPSTDSCYGVNAQSSHSPTQGPASQTTLMIWTITPFLLCASLNWLYLPSPSSGPHGPSLAASMSVSFIETAVFWGHCFLLSQVVAAFSPIYSILRVLEVKSTSSFLPITTSKLLLWLYPSEASVPLKCM